MEAKRYIYKEITHAILHLENFLTYDDNGDVRLALNELKQILKNNPKRKREDDKKASDYPYQTNM